MPVTQEQKLLLTNSKDVVIQPLYTEPGDELVSFDGNELFFQNGDKQRRVVLPFCHHAQVQYERYPLDALAGNPDADFIGFVTPSAGAGNAYLEVSIENSKGVYFAVAHIRKNRG